MRKILTLAVAALSAMACNNYEPQNIPGPSPELYFVEKTATKDYNTAQLKAKVEELPFIGQKISNAIPMTTVRTDAITYNTVTPDGKPVVASGIVVYPLSGPVKGVVAGLHYTITSNAEAPSVAMVAPESLFGLFGYAVIITDYIGFGKTADKVHPYLHVENTGIVEADMVRAATEYMKSIDRELPDNSLYAVGYSQGGASVLAFQKVVERSYPDIKILHTYSGGGPIDLTSTYNLFIADNYTGYPCSVPYISIGLDYGDNLGLNFGNVFKEPLLSSYPEWYNSKKYNSVQVNEFIGSNIISDFMNEDMFKPERNADLDKLYTSLARNSLLEGWTPRAPISLMHAVSDSYVPFLNSKNAYESYRAKGCNVVLQAMEGDHMDALMPFYFNAIESILRDGK